jgi:hypothetical protein
LRTTALLLVAAAFAAAPPRAARAGEPEAEALPEAEVAVAEPPPEVLEVLARVDAAGNARGAAAAELASAYPWPRLVAALGEVSGDFRRPERGEILLDALSRMGREKLREMLVFAAQEGADSYLRLVALQASARAGGETPFGDLLTLAAALPAAERVSPSIRNNVREAVRCSLEASPKEVETLRSRWREVDQALRDIALDALEKSGAALGTRAVSRLLGTGAEGDAKILVRLSSMPRRSADPFAAGTDAALLQSLASTRPEERRAAALFAGRIGGMALAERLVEALGDPDPGVAAAAGKALTAATGVALVPDADRGRRARPPLRPPRPPRRDRPVDRGLPRPPGAGRPQGRLPGPRQARPLRVHPAAPRRDPRSGAGLRARRQHRPLRGDRPPRAEVPRGLEVPPPLSRGSPPVRPSAEACRHSRGGPRARR